MRQKRAPVVVKELLSSSDVPPGEDAYAMVSVDQQVLHIAIGLGRVIGKAQLVSSMIRIDHGLGRRTEEIGSVFDVVDPPSSLGLFIADQLTRVLA